MRKFTQVPNRILKDVLDGELIGNDLVVYIHLLNKAGHGKPIYLTNEKIGKDLGGMSVGKISASLNRLSRTGHIKRRKTSTRTETTLKTFVQSSKRMYVKGKPE